MPRLSLMDRRTLRRIAMDSEAYCPEPLVMVLAGGKNMWQPAIFQQPPRRGGWFREAPMSLREW
jgi:hypothetical protein